MFCNHCGKPLAENAAFCPHCGTAVFRPRQAAAFPQQAEFPTRQDAVSPQQAESPDQQKDSPPETTKHRILRTLRGIVCILISLFGIFCYATACLSSGSLMLSASDLIFLFQVGVMLLLGIIWVSP